MMKCKRCTCRDCEKRFEDPCGACSYCAEWGHDVPYTTEACDMKEAGDDAETEPG